MPTQAGQTSEQVSSADELTELGPECAWILEHAYFFLSARVDR